MLKFDTDYATITIDSHLGSTEEFEVKDDILNGIKEAENRAETLDVENEELESDKELLEGQKFALLELVTDIYAITKRNDLHGERLEAIESFLRDGKYLFEDHIQEPTK